jgi:hypothetical protein
VCANFDRDALVAGRPRGALRTSTLLASAARARARGWELVHDNGHPGAARPRRRAPRAAERGGGVERGGGGGSGGGRDGEDPAGGAGAGWHS